MPGATALTLDSVDAERGVSVGLLGAQPREQADGGAAAVLNQRLGHDLHRHGRRAKRERLRALHHLASNDCAINKSANSHDSMAEQGMAQHVKWEHAARGGNTKATPEAEAYLGVDGVGDGHFRGAAAGQHARIVHNIAHLRGGQQNGQRQREIGL